MLREYRIQTILGIWGGFLFFWAGYFSSSSKDRSAAIFGVVLMVLSYVLFICGCFMYSRGKGRSWYFGLMGFLGPVGLVFLYCLQDKSKMVMKRRQKELS